MNNEETMSASIEALAVALSKAQAAIENVEKDTQGYGYKYATLASCLEAIKKPLADNGLSIIQPISQSKDGKSTLVTMLIHSSGQWIKSISNIEVAEIKNKDGRATTNELQQFGAATTYMRRYALSAMIGLAQEDTDAQEARKTKVESENKNQVSKFMNLCKENHINAKEFACHFKIDSSKQDSVKNGIENFFILKEQFLTKQRLTTNHLTN